MEISNWDGVVLGTLKEGGIRIRREGDSVQITCNSRQTEFSNFWILPWSENFAAPIIIWSRLYRRQYMPCAPYNEIWMIGSLLDDQWGLLKYREADWKARCITQPSSVGNAMRYARNPRAARPDAATFMPSIIPFSTRPERIRISHFHRPSGGVPTETPFTAIQLSRLWFTTFLWRLNT